MGRMNTGPPPEFDVALRGYDRAQVHALLQRIATGAVDAAQAHQELATLSSTLRGYHRRQVTDYVTGAVGPPPPGPHELFPVVLRGYECSEVDQALREFEAGRLSAEQLQVQTFTMALRGYDVSQVDAYIDQATSQP
jgi:DivIVA domain-containing protein